MSLSELAEIKRELSGAVETFRTEIRSFDSSLQGEMVGLAESLRADLRTEIRSFDSSLRGEMVGLAELLRAELRTETESLRAELRTEIRSFDSSLRAEMVGLAESLRADLRTETGTLRTETGALRTETGALRTEIAELKRHVGVVAEELRTEIRLVAEGVAAGDSKLDREVGSLRIEMRSGFDEMRTLMRVAYVDLDERLRKLEP